MTGTARTGSDLDLLIDIGRPLTLDERAQLSVRLEESALPFRVDFVDRHCADPAFFRSLPGSAAHCDRSENLTFSLPVELYLS